MESGIQDYKVVIMKNIVTIAALLFFLLFFVGCRESESGDSGNSKVDPQIYDYSERDVTSFWEESGAELVVLNYWATFCAPCKKEMVDLSRLQTEFRDEGLLVVGASIDDSAKLSLIKSIALELRVNYPILYGVPAEFAGQSIIGLPVTFFINKKGELLERVDNKRDYSFFEERVKHYLGREESSFSGAGASAVESSYFDFTYDIKPGEGQKELLRLTLAPSQDYYLNGEGYPPIKLEFIENDELRVNPAVLESPGVKVGEKVSWLIELESLTESNDFLLEGRLSVIACTEDSCNFVNEIFSLPLNFQKN